MAAVLFSSHQGWGQAPVVSLSGPTCTTGTITLTSSVTPARIVWKFNGTTQSTVNATWNSTGTTVAGGNGAGTGLNQLQGPNSLAMDGSGNIYVAEYLNNRVIEFPSGSTSLTNGTVVAGYANGASGTDASHLNGPSGLFVDGSGNIYVSDEGNNRIQKFPSGSTAGTNATTVAGQGGSSLSQLNSPEGLFVDGSGNIFVADQGNNRVMKFPSTSTLGTAGTIAAGGNGNGSGANQLNSPTGIFISSGFLYVADFGNNRIQDFGVATSSSSSTNATTVAGGNGNGSAANQLNNPTNVYVDGLGNIYVADAYNNRIQQWASGATTGTTVAGSSAGTSGSSSTLLNLPYTVLLDANGNIYTCDYNNYRVQEFTSTINMTYNANSMGTWSAVVTSFNGLSNTATITINVPPSLSSSPTSQTICAGGNTSFTGGGTGSGLTYQWQVSTDGGTTYNNVSGAVYSGATTTTLSITGATTAMSGYMYQLVISGTCTPPVTTSAATLTVNALPAITTNPTNATICAAGNNTTGNTSFTVAGSGAGTLTYQWQVNTGSGYTNLSDGGIYSGSGTSTLSLTGAGSAQNGYMYRAVVSGTCTPPATSTGATLTVNPIATISTQPSSVAVCANGNATFTVVSSGGTTYQWVLSTDGGTTWNNVVNGVPTTGATTQILQLSGVTTSMNGYQYKLLITTAAGCSMYSNVATLTVYGLPTITTQPSAQTVCVGSPAAFSVAATGQGLTYQWQLNTGSGFSNIGGATSSSYSISSPTAGMNGYQYHVIVSGTCAPSVTSSAVTLNVQTPPSVTTSPTDQTVCAGNNATFTVVAGGNPIAYQWQVNTGSGFSNIGGATSASYTANAVTAGMNGYQYQVIVSGTGACTTPATSGTATLHVNTAPNITTQPTDQTVCATYPATFSVSATGTNLTYQWQLNTGSGFNNITGATSSSYNTGAITTSMNGYQYQVIISGTCTPNVTSSVATLHAQATPSITLGSNPAVCVGATTANISFSGITGGATTVSNTYTYTGSVQTVTLPSNVSSITFDAVGGQGATAHGLVNTSYGGAGGRIQGTLPVTGGATLNIYVGGAASGATGGYNGGGNGYVNGPYNGGGGGGASDIRIGGTALTNRMVVAGGGGGDATDGTTIYNGGDGGGNTGASGAGTGTAATGGTQSAGGSAGSLGGTFGSAGASGAGGAGGPGISGGGGAGYYGGGGGRWGSGGGGSSYADPSATVSSNIQGYNASGNGYVAVSYTAPANNYSIVWSTAATTAGFTNVTAATIPTGSNISLAVPPGAAPGTYTGNLYVSNANCTSQAYPISVTVNSLPAVTTQSTTTSSTICSGGNTSFGGDTASGAGLSYQWNLSTNGGTSYTAINAGNAGTIYSGYATNTLSITGATTGMNGYLYQLVASGTCTPPVTFTPDTLHVNAPTSITTQPTNQTICSGNTATFTVAATGGNLTYQWYRSTDGGTTFNALVGQTGASHTTTLTSQNGYQYYVVVTGSCGSVTSNTVTLFINTAPAVTSTPSGSTICAGNNTSFTASATGTNINYQWQVSTNGGTSYTAINAGNAGTIYSGYTTNTLNITGATAGMNGYLYNVVVSGTCPPSATSVADTLHINTPPAIGTQPGNQTVCSGSNVTFSVSGVTGTNVQYQWNVNTGSGATPISGAMSNSLTLTGVTTSMSGNIYSVTLSGTCGTLTSNNATLTVNATPSAPTAQSGLPDSVCLGNSFSIALGGGPSNAWYVVNGPSSYTATTQSSSLLVNGSVTAANSGVYVVYDSAYYGGGNSCKSATTSDTLVIGIPPTINAAGSVTPAVCYGQQIQFFSSVTIPSGATNVKYYWQGPVNGSQFLPNGNLTGGTDYVDAAPYKSAAQFTDAGTYQFTMSSQFGSQTCYSVPPTPPATGFSGSFTVTVNALPATPTVLPLGSGPGDTILVCFASPISLLANSTTGGVSYKWTGPNGVGDTQLTATYSQAAAAFANSGKYFVTAKNSTTGCLSIGDTVYVRVKPVPGNPTATSNSPICTGATLNLMSTSSNADSFSWSGPGIPAFQSSLQNPSIVSTPVIDSGTYIVRAYQQQCASLLSASTHVTVNPIPQDPTATLSASSPLCEGTSVTITANDSSSNVTYSWHGKNALNNNLFNSNQQTITFNPVHLTDSGLYSVFAYYATGCHSANPATVALNVLPRPSTPTATTNAPICAGSTLTLNYSIGAPFNTGTIPYWTGPGITNSQLQTATTVNIPGAPITDSGIYTVYATLNGCFSYTPATVHATIWPVPANPVASSNSPVCSGPSNKLKLFADSNTTLGPGPLTYLWSGTGGLSASTRNPVINNPSTSNTGYDSVYTQNSYGCKSLLPGVTQVTVNPSPNAPTVTNETLCQFSPAAQLTANGTSLLWYSGPAGGVGSPTAPVPDDSLPGVFNYYVTQSTGVGCESPRAAVVVTVNQKPAPPYVASNVITYCQYDGSSVLSATGQNMLWYTTASGGVGSPIAPTPSTVAPANYIYYVSQTVNGCESDRQPITVVVRQKPQPPIVQDISYCQYDAAQPLTAVGQNLRWYNVGYGGVGTPIPPVPQTGYPDTMIYYVTQTVNGCESERVPQHVYIFYKPNVVIKTPASYVCQHDTMTFYYFGNALPSASFDWQLPQGAIIVSSTSPDVIVVRFDSAGNQNLTLTVSNGSCKSAATTLIVQVRPQPYAAISSLHSVCQDDIVQVGLTSQTNGTQFYNYNFDGGTVISSASTGGPYNIQWTTPGTHIVQLVTTLNNCQSQIAYDTVQVHPIPDAHIVGVNAQDLNNICSGDSVEVTANLVNDAYQYQWSPAQFFRHGNNEPMLYANIDFSSTIYLQVTSNYGCIGNDSVYVNIQPCCSLYLPNAFTPNGDGKNDIFHILTIGHHTIRDFRILNRWGETVFQTNDENIGWDGKYQGVPQDMDTYFYFIDYVCQPGNKEMKQQGEVYLVR